MGVIHDETRSTRSSWWARSPPLERAFEIATG
jgi:hypothetical protein